MAPTLTAEEIEALDPYSFLAALGKKVVRPGGSRSTQQLYDMAALRPGEKVLDVGCGVGVTGIEIVQRFGCEVTLVDHSTLMVDEARRNVAAAGLDGQIRIDEGDILKLPYADGEFDVVIVEAVTMFVDRWFAVRELKRVLRPGGRLLDQEFVWRNRPDAKALEILKGPKMCPGIDFDDVRDWGLLFENAGFTGVRNVVGPFQLMNPREFVRDEGVANTLRIVGRTFSRMAYLRKAAWLMRNIVSIMPSLGYIVLRAEVPDDSAA
jgi:SAM-dependent methyltransferase